MRVNFEKTYEHIGALLYGIACRKEKMSAEDRLRLTEFIEKTWRGTNSTDPLSMHLVDCIHGGVRYAIVNATRADDALQSFADYYRINAPSFGDSLKQKITTSALQLAAQTRPNTEHGVESYLKSLLTSKTN